MARRKSILPKVMACAVWLTSVTAVAQTPPHVDLIEPPPEPPTPVAPVMVTVTAPEPLSPTQIKSKSLRFVQAYAAATPRLGQIARWREPICAEISGVTPLEAYQLQARLEDVARSVGAPVIKSGCTANVEIRFTDAPQTLLDRIAERQEEALGYFHRGQTKALKTVTRPIQAWYMTATTGTGGPTVGASFASVGSARNDSEVIDDPESIAPNGCGDSRFSACLQSVFKHVLVVVDSGRVRKHGWPLVSDYVAMLVLSQARAADGCRVLPSVTDLFAACPGRAAPEGLTSTDSAYLSALYAADPEANKAGQQSDIAGRMAAILIKTSAAAR